jgi:predicted RNase H-like nuclease
MIVGVDGCRGGWYAVHSDDAGFLEGTVHASLESLCSAHSDSAIIAVDIPIGLVERGARECDLAARSFLGAVRGASVFPAPLRAVLGAMSHHEASERRAAIEAKRMSIQAFAILAKVAEVDTLLRHEPRHEARVFEVHPEVSFTAMNARRPIIASKKKREGRDERLQLLRKHYGDAPVRLISERPKSIVEADDVLDALAAHWSAERIHSGRSESLPVLPSRDKTGLKMAIYF